VKAFDTGPDPRTAEAIAALRDALEAASAKQLPSLCEEIAKLEAIARIRLIARSRLLASAETAPPPDDEIRTYTTAQLAELWNLPEPHIRELCRSKRIPAVKNGKYWQIPAVALRAWLDAQGVIPSAKPGRRLAQSARGFDKDGSHRLPSEDDPGRGAPSPPSPRAHAVEIRRVARRPPRYGQAMGDGDPGHERDRRSADPPLDGSEGDGTA